MKDNPLRKLNSQSVSDASKHYHARLPAELVTLLFSMPTGAVEPLSAQIDSEVLRKIAEQV